LRYRHPSNEIYKNTFNFFTLQDLSLLELVVQHSPIGLLIPSEESGKTNIQPGRRIFYLAAATIKEGSSLQISFFF
jgi:hypothetical protein